MVDHQPRVAGGMPIETTTSGSNYLLGCSQDRRMGSSLPPGSHRGSLVEGGKRIEHKRSRTLGSRTSYQDLHKGSETKSNSYEDRQYLSSIISSKNGGTGSLEMITITKRIWFYLIQNKITITAEWIPSHLNTIADWESRNVKDTAEWKLCPKVFRAICQTMEQPTVDLFASRISHQLKTYFSWKADPDCLAVDTFR